MEKLKWYYEALENCISEQVSKGLENVDADEMGKAIDMLKDISQTMYYVSVTKAMENDGKPVGITLDMIDRV